MTNLMLTVRLILAPNGQLSSVIFVLLIFEVFFMVNSGRNLYSKKSESRKIHVLDGI